MSARSIGGLQPEEEAEPPLEEGLAPHSGEAGLLGEEAGLLGEGKSASRTFVLPFRVRELEALEVQCLR